MYLISGEALCDNGYISAYKSSLGETDPLTQLAKAHMESNEAKFKGTSI